MALERLAKAKALFGMLARGVRDAMRPEPVEGPTHDEEDLPAVLRPREASPGAPMPPPAAMRAVEAAPRPGDGEAARDAARPVLVTPPPPRPPDPALLEAAASELADPRFSGVRVVADASHVAIAWRAPAERLAVARRLAEGPLALRMIAVRAKGADDVEVDTLELGPAEAEGTCVVVRPASMLRAVASVGLASNERFVSVAHADAA